MYKYESDRIDDERRKEEGEEDFSEFLTRREERNKEAAQLMSCIKKTEQNPKQCIFEGYKINSEEDVLGLLKHSFRKKSSYGNYDYVKNEKISFGLHMVLKMVAGFGYRDIDPLNCKYNSNLAKVLHTYNPALIPDEVERYPGQLYCTDLFIDCENAGKERKFCDDLYGISNYSNHDNFI